jgi:hypothetical protein
VRLPRSPCRPRHCHRAPGRDLCDACIAPDQRPCPSRRRRAPGWDLARTAVIVPWLGSRLCHRRHTLGRDLACIAPDQRPCPSCRRRAPGWDLARTAVIVPLAGISPALPSSHPWPRSLSAPRHHTSSLACCVTNVHCNPKHCDDFFNSSRFYDVFLFFVTDVH